eukprot:8782962-Pyramimonas_sp.AAC.1
MFMKNLAPPRRHTDAHRIHAIGVAVSAVALKHREEGHAKVLRGLGGLGEDRKNSAFGVRNNSVALSQESPGVSRSGQPPNGMPIGRAVHDDVATREVHRAPINNIPFKRVQDGLSGRGRWRVGGFRVLPL